MPCSFANDPDKKKRTVRLCVSRAIKKVDGNLRPVTQLTLLGHGGLGHTPTKRRLYRAAINEELLKEGGDCGMKTLVPDDFSASALLLVRDVSDLVEADL